MKETQIKYDVLTKEYAELEVEVSQEELDARVEQQRVSEIQQKMSDIVQELNASDWKTVKYMELGVFDDEYDQHIIYRNSLRELYNALELELKG